MYNSNIVHDSTPPQGENCDSNRILLHPLYGCIPLSDLHCRTSASIFVHNLGGAMAPRTVRGTITTKRMAVHHPKRTTVMQMAFWYNRRRDLYSMLT